VIRRAFLGDYAAIGELLETAFPSPQEAALVCALRHDGDLVLELVSVVESVIGYVAFSRMSMKPTDLRITALAPLAVAEGYRRRGHGTALVTTGLEMLAESGEDLVLVLGDPDYYARFGFSARAAQELRTPYSGPALQARALTECARQIAGTACYAPAFAALS
jgi:putative acetyltransferase